MTRSCTAHKAQKGGGDRQGSWVRMGTDTLWRLFQLAGTEKDSQVCFADKWEKILRFLLK
jgi:hypothetical protein